jgi:fumarate reductase subunit D
MFLKPSLSEVSIIYTLPFKRSVWVAYIAVMAILTLAMFITHRMEHKMDPSKPQLTFGDAVLNSLALMCQEGEQHHTRFPN